MSTALRASYHAVMHVDQRARLAAAAATAAAAQEDRDVWAANAAWERHRLIEDAMRDPQERLDLGISLSKTAIALWLASSTTSPRS